MKRIGNQTAIALILLAAGVLFTLSGLVLIGPVFLILGGVILLNGLRKK